MLCAYADIGTNAAAEGVFKQALARYNRKCKPMQLVFFGDALDQLLRMHRTLCLPQVPACSHTSSTLAERGRVGSVAAPHMQLCG